MTKDILIRLIVEKKLSYSEIGRRYGVSDNAIRKRAKKFGIDLLLRRKVKTERVFSSLNTKPQETKKSKVFLCEDELFIEIIKTSTTFKEIGEKLGYKSKVLSMNVKNNIRKRSEMLGMSLEKFLIKREGVLEKTKGELKTVRGNYQSYRSAIRKSAYNYFL